MALKVSSKLS